MMSPRPTTDSCRLRAGVSCEHRAALGCWLAVALITAGCKEPAPERVDLELPDQVLSTLPVQALVWKYDADNVRSVGKGKYDYNVDPANIATVSPTGSITCQESGDAKLTVSILGKSASADLKCRIVDHIEAPELGRVDIAGGEMKLDVAAYTKDGTRLDDVPVTLTTPNTAVVKASGGKLTPMLIGTAKIKAKAAEVTKEFSVDIVRKLEPEALPIDDNTRIHFSLEPGNYELIVELEAAKELKMEWRGAPHCNYSATEKVHKKVCVLRAKGGVVFDNPAYLNSGSKEVSRAGVTIHEVPLR